MKKEEKEEEIWINKVDVKFIKGMWMRDLRTQNGWLLRLFIMI